ncbi:MAG: hypothetical protein Q9201_005211 [Fulgogasparrea decipioides]
MVLYGLIVPMLPYVLLDRTPFLLGLIALGLSTLAIALTREIIVLLIARILQGLSSAVVYTVGYAILFDVIGSEKIGQAMGYLSMSQSLGLLVGPAVGGPLYECGGYFATFIPAFVLIAIEIGLRFVVVVPKRGQSEKEEDKRQEEEEGSRVTLLVKGYTANPLYGTSFPPQADIENIRTSASSENDTKCTTSQQPDHDLKSPSTTPTRNPLALLLSSPRILIACLALFIINTVLTAYDATIPIYIHTTFSLPASSASLLFLIIVAPFILSPISGSITDRYGPKSLATLGILITVFPVLGLAYVNASTPHAFSIIAIMLSIIGFANAMCLPALMAEVSLVVERMERVEPGVFGPQGAVALAFGVMNTAFAAGFMAGGGRAA